MGQFTSVHMMYKLTYNARQTTLLIITCYSWAVAGWCYPKRAAVSTSLPLV